jgi:peptide/nickel transport system substrate-binding protein
VDPGELSIELIAYNDRPEFGDVAAVIQNQLGELGIEVKIKGGEYAALEPDMFSGDFDATLLSRGYLVDVADPGGYLASDWACEGGYNIAHYCDPGTDQMIQDAVALEDADERAQAYQELATKLQDEAASGWLLHENALWDP